MVKLLLPQEDPNAYQVIEAYSIDDCFKALSERLNFTDATLTVNGEDLRNIDFCTLADLSIVSVDLSVKGGKGGFGSLLRIAAAQKKHFNNFDSSRDSNGRRLRDIKNELRLIEFVRKQNAERKMIDEEMVNLKKQQEGKPSDPTFTHRLEVEENYKQKVNQWEYGFDETVKRGLTMRKTQRLRSKKEDNEEQGYDTLQEKEETLGKRSMEERIITKEPEKKIKFSYMPDDNKNGELSQEKPNHTLKVKDSNYQIIGPTLPTSITSSAKCFADIDLKMIESFEQLENMEPEHIKHELKRLGLKFGGAPKERVRRLWDIKINPSNLFSSKYISK